MQSFLVTSDDADCNKVNLVAKSIQKDLAWLQKNGTPVWRNVDLEMNKNISLERTSTCFSLN